MTLLEFVHDIPAIRDEAKALWGDNEPNPPKYVRKRTIMHIPARELANGLLKFPAEERELNLDHIEYDLTPGGYLYHLEQMLKSDDPLAYYEQHKPKGK